MLDWHMLADRSLEWLFRAVSDFAVQFWQRTRRLQNLLWNGVLVISKRLLIASQPAPPPPPKKILAYFSRAISIIFVQSRPASQNSAALIPRSGLLHLFAGLPFSIIWLCFARLIFRIWPLFCRHFLQARLSRSHKNISAMFAHLLLKISTHIVRLWELHDSTDLRHLRPSHFLYL